MRNLKRNAHACTVTLFILLLSLLAIQAAFADERILRFESEIVVNADGSADVVETINVRAERDAIRRGIFRDVLTKPGQRVTFDGATRDGEPDGIRTEHKSDRVRLYVGRKDRLLAKGNYIYQLTYSVSNVVSAYPDHEQLYWNITGSNWAFPIDFASATVTFDADVPLDEIQARAFTGKQGDRGNSSAIMGEGDGAIRVETTKPLRANHGLTIVAGIPKGYFTIAAQPVRAPAKRTPATIVSIEEPLSKAQIWNITAVASAVPITYFLLVWVFIGRDPLRGRVRTLFDPPKDISPAAARFLTQQAYDRTNFTAAIINMAAKGHLTIRRKGERYEIAYGSKDRSLLSPDEKALSRSLGLAKGETLETTSANAMRLLTAAKDHAENLTETYKGSHFTLNRGWWFLGCLISMAIIAVPVVYIDSPEAGFAFIFGPMLVIPAGFATHGIALIVQAARGRNAYGSKHTHFTKALGTGLFFLIPAGVVCAVFIVLLGVVEYGLIAAMSVALGAVCWLFFVLLPAPTHVGRQALDQIEAFKRSLLGERGSLADRVSSSDAPAYFDERLAYAVALGIANDWAAQFANAFGSSSDEMRYRPSWYHDPTMDPSDYEVINMTRFIGTGFAGAIGNVSPPMPEGGSGGSGGSSFGGGGFSGGGFGGGGFGGGGFSGGGSGGGGGGGW